MYKIVPGLLLSVLSLVVANTAIAQKSAGEHLDDTTITARVKYELFDQAGELAMDINIETAKGVVQLAGWVDSEADKTRAGEIARKSEGVVAVSNRLLVSGNKRSAGRVLDDSLLAAKVKLALGESPETSWMSINVEVRNADVELSGFVDTYAERDVAVAMVEKMDGVGGVINSIDITPQ
jgi:hyperosmotically inducible protein